MTDVSKLKELANKISGADPNIRNYALGQADASVSQEAAIRRVEAEILRMSEEIEVLKGKGSGGSAPPPVTGSGVSYTVNPKGLATTVYVDYGPDPKLLASITSGVAIGSGIANVTGVVTLPSLSANTVYFYRVRSVNSQGESVSKTRWFITAAVGGTIRRVGSGQTYSDLGSAVAAAAAGDTIIVHAGSYGTVNIAKNYGSVVRIVRNGNDAVSFNALNISSSRNIYFGSGFTVNGATFAASSDNHLINIVNSSYIWFDTITSAWVGSATGDVSPFWLAVNSDWIFAMGSIFRGGGVMKSYTGLPNDSASWPLSARFLDCEFSEQSADIWHMNGAADFLFESCWFHDPNPVPIPAEHHDGIQWVYGNGLVVRRCKFTWSGPNENGDNQAILLGNLVGNTSGDCYIENVLMVGWKGCGLNCQGANAIVRNLTQWDCYGVKIGLPTDKNPDLITGRTGDQLNVKNSIAYRAYTNNAGGAVPVASNNHFQQGANFASTSTTTGTPGFVNAAGGDYRPAIGGNLYKTGIADANAPKWDIDGRGYGPIPSKGCYAPSDVTTPQVVAAGYTP